MKDKIFTVSKVVFYLHFFVCPHKIVKLALSFFKVAHNVRVLLQVGDFIMSSPELQLGFIQKLKIRTFAWLCSSAETAADSDL